MDNFSEKVSFLWSVADRLRGDFKQHEYGGIILPFTVLRRLDQVLAPTRAKVQEALEKYGDKEENFKSRMLLRASGVGFYNTSPFTIETMLADPDNIGDNLHAYVAGYSQNVRDIMDKFKFSAIIDDLVTAGILYTVLQRFKDIDLDPYKRNADGSVLVLLGQPVENVSNLEMGYIYEELIRKFAEQANETAGEHFTPREVIRLMVNLLFIEDNEVLTKQGIVRTMYDSCCGTGGMLSVAERFLMELNPNAQLKVYGQELNPGNYALCKADMLIKGHGSENIYFGSSLRDDQMTNKVDYCISNPPFGVDWSKDYKDVMAESERGAAGRFGPGTPRKSDGSLLFLLHLLSKLKPIDEAGEGGGRLAIVLNGSPLFTGSAGSGESEIRKYIFENDLLEAIIALPTDMFYNTGIATYVWILSNKKNPMRKGKMALINGVELYQSMRKSLGSKRKELSDEHIQQITQMYGDMTASDTVKFFKNEDFGYSRITVERPLRLRFQVTEEQLEQLNNQSAWNNLLKSKKKDEEAKKAEIEKGQAVQNAVLASLKAMGDTVYTDRAKFLEALKKGIAKDVKVSGTVAKAVWSAIGVQDENAEPCKDSKGNIEPDTSLRDNENVPLTESIEDYMKREVLPHVPDAWVDDSKTVVGYEIPFTRHFYVYEPPRALELIEADLLALEKQIAGFTAEVLG